MLDSVIFLSGRRRLTRCALVTGVQTCALPIYSGRETQSGPARSAWPAKPPMFDPAVATPIIAPPSAALPLAGTAGAPPADAPGLPQSAVRPEYRNSGRPLIRSEEHTSELQSLMRNSYAVFCLKKNNNKPHSPHKTHKK